MADRITLAELAAESGAPARTIRFYIARGLLDGPVKAGRVAEYTQAHSERLKQIRSMQDRGLTLTEIARALAGAEAAPAVAAASPWWQYALADDVIVLTRADASPWRTRQLQQAIQEMASRVGPHVDQEDQRASVPFSRVPGSAARPKSLKRS